MLMLSCGVSREKHEQIGRFAHFFYISFQFQKNAACFTCGSTKNRHFLMTHYYLISVYIYDAVRRPVKCNEWTFSPFVDDFFPGSFRMTIVAEIVACYFQSIAPIRVTLERKKSSIGKKCAFIADVLSPESIVVSVLSYRTSLFVVSRVNSFNCWPWIDKNWSTYCKQ